MPYYSYVIRSLKNEMLYKDSTQNIRNRLQYHNLGKVTFTSKFTPWELVLSESFNTRTEATKREKCFMKPWTLVQINFKDTAKISIFAIELLVLCGILYPILYSEIDLLS